MRKRRAEKKELNPDYKYNSILVTKFINKLMWRGKKTVAERIFYNAVESASKKLKMPPLELINKAIENVRPLLEVRPRRVGGATYQVPIEVRSERGIELAIRWIIMFSRQREGKAMEKKLEEELISAVKKEGLAIKKREDTHKMAEANRAFAHYRW